MPTELTPGSYHHSPLEYISRSLPGWVNGPVAPGLGSSMPGTGPARAIECLPGPNKCLPNGLRNPWAPYSGHSYMPSSLAAENMQAQSMGGFGGGSFTAGSLAPVQSVIAPGRTVRGSVIAPRSVAGSMMSYRSGGLGGLRDDDGWGGSQGRIHNGLEPDLSSTAGALPPIATSASAWLYSPSSPANHARLSPQSPEVYMQPPMTEAGSYRPRRASMRPVSIDQCPDCPPVRQRSNSQSFSQADRPLPPAASSSQGPYKRLGGSPNRGSPLRPSPEEPLSRKVSLNSRRSNRSSRCCSECKA